LLVEETEGVESASPLRLALGAGNQHQYSSASNHLLALHKI